MPVGADPLIQLFLREKKLIEWGRRRRGSLNRWVIRDGYIASSSVHSGCLDTGGSIASKLHLVAMFLPEVLLHVHH